MDRKIRQLARKWGTKIWKRSCYDEFAFNGKTIAEYGDKDCKVARTDSNLIHDIAHFVVADPERRTIPEFGLGESPDSNKEAQSAKGITASSAQTEEELASVLGIWWERELGLAWNKTYKNHSWDWVTVTKGDEQGIFNFDATHRFAKRLQELRRRKII